MTRPTAAIRRASRARLGLCLALLGATVLLGLAEDARGGGSAKRASAPRMALDRALAERVLAGYRQKGRQAKNAVELSQVLAQDIPGLRDYHIIRLKERYGELLAELPSRTLSPRLTRLQKYRIRKLTLQRPFADLRQLAALFRADPVLGPALPWSEQEVSRLQTENKIVPSEAHRARSLARRVARELKRSPAAGDPLAIARRRFPQLDGDRLEALAIKEPRLARALVVARTEPFHYPRFQPHELTLASARQLRLSAALLLKGLGQPQSALVSRLGDRLAAIDREGNNDGVLSTTVDVPESALLKKDPLLRAVLDTFYKLHGKKSYPLGEICAGLPLVVARVAARGTRKNASPFLQELYLEAARETVGVLTGSYRQQVLDGGQTVSIFLERELDSLPHSTKKRLLTTLPTAFPNPNAGPLAGERLDRIARLYRELVGGKLNVNAFFQRSGLSKEELLILQQADPRFTKPAGTPSWFTVSGRKQPLVKEPISTTPGLRQLFDGDSRLRAEVVGRKAKEIFARDVLVTRADIFATLNADPAIREQFGAITEQIYDSLRRKHGEYFPDLTDRGVVFETLAQEVRGLLAEKPDLTPNEITTAMMGKHPRFTSSRLHTLQGRYPALVPDHTAPAVPKAQRQQDARRLAELLIAQRLKRPSLKLIADRLGQEDARFSLPYLHRLRQEFRPLFARTPMPYQPRTFFNSSLAAAELLELVIRLSPPGTPELELRRGLNALFEERGLPPCAEKLTSGPIYAKLVRRHGTLDAQHAATAAELVAEYARAAPRGASEAEILRQVFADYPTLRNRFQRYRALWLQDPERYEDLLRGGFLRRTPAGVRLMLTGHGLALRRKRFLGGWDAERALFGKGRNTRLDRELARLSQFAKIQFSLPLLDELVDGLAGSRPLRGHNIIWVTHALGSIPPLARAFQEAGASMKSMVIVGTPYGSNEAVVETLHDRRVPIVVPALDEADYRRRVEQGVDRIFALWKRNHKPVLAIDDGGLVNEILHERLTALKRKHRQQGTADALDELRTLEKFVAAVKGTEQTTGGLNRVADHELQTFIIRAARSLPKAVEAEFIGKSTARKLVQALRRTRSIRGATIVQIGYGQTGEWMARALKEKGARVLVVERSRTNARKAREQGFEVFDEQSKPLALRQADIVVGTTGAPGGKPSLELAEMRLLKSGVVIASTSSKQAEFAMKDLQQVAPKPKRLRSRNPLVRLPTCRYQLDGKELIAVGDGWPINFDGDTEDIPAELIQITRGLMFVTALQAATIKSNNLKDRGVLEMLESQQQTLVKRFRALKPQEADWSRCDPDAWPEVIRETSRTIQRASRARD